jgi:hypothetical protein
MGTSGKDKSGVVVVEANSGPSNVPHDLTGRGLWADVVSFFALDQPAGRIGGAGGMGGIGGTGSGGKSAGGAAGTASGSGGAPAGGRSAGGTAVADAGAEQ